VWQAEADINCNRQADYPCLQKQLISSYREQFNSTEMNFVAVQLPGDLALLTAASHAVATACCKNRSAADCCCMLKLPILLHCIDQVIWLATVCFTCASHR
jgi:hypothetical protein